MRLLIWVRCVDNLERFFVVSCLFAISTTKWSISVVTSSCCSSCLTAQGYNHASDALWPQEWLNLGKSAVRLGQREINSMRKGNLFRLPTAARVQKGEFAKDFHKLIKKKKTFMSTQQVIFFLQRSSWTNLGLKVLLEEWGHVPFPITRYCSCIWSSLSSHCASDYLSFAQRFCQPTVKLLSQ